MTIVLTHINWGLYNHPCWRVIWVPGPHSEPWICSRKAVWSVSLSPFRCFTFVVHSPEDIRMVSSFPPFSYLIPEYFRMFPLNSAYFPWTTCAFFSSVGNKNATSPGIKIWKDAPPGSMCTWRPEENREKSLRFSPGDASTYFETIHIGVF